MENNVLQQLKENIAKVMIGNERTIELVLTCLVAKGPFNCWSSLLGGFFVCVQLARFWVNIS